MKNFVLLFLATISLSSCASETETPSTLRSVAQSSQDYCIALRGNGESEPAHWGALAQTVEQYGMPSAMAGGSSATISMFLMESIATNSTSDSEPSPNFARSFMLKSLVGFFSNLKQTPLWNDVEKLYGAYKNYSTEGWFATLEKAVADQDAAAAVKVYDSAVVRSSIDPETTAELKKAFLEKNFALAKFLLSEVKSSASVFGKFNADDPNLFFRGGIVNFNNAATLFGKIAGFYSAESSEPLRAEWKSLLKTCSPNTEGMLWQDIVAKRPECEKSFSKMFKVYFASATSDVKPEEKMIGRKFEVYATSTILAGSAEQDYRAARSKYFTKMDPEFGKDFRPSNPDDIHFGYWGKTARLKEIQSNLNMNDEKARRFLPLGPATWKQVLSVSPAEPGLSPFKEFKNFSGQKYISAGGWSDLHPVDVLKAAGCSNVIYITRKGDESPFAERIAERLGLDTTKLYDLGNLQSSFARALKHSSSVLCTNWNDFDVRSQAGKLIEDSYRAPFLLSVSPTKEPVRGCSLKIAD